MSIDEPKRIVPPPSEPVNIGLHGEWQSIQKIIGVELPDDYVDLVSTYGSGAFLNGELEIANPFDRAYPVWIEYELAKLQSHSFPADIPYGVFPNPDGLYPFGRDGNGNRFYWLTVGKPNEWPIACRSKSYEWDKVKHGISDFLLLLVTNELEIKYDRYWGNSFFTDEDRVFEPQRRKVDHKR